MAWVVACCTTLFASLILYHFLSYSRKQGSVNDPTEAEATPTPLIPTIDPPTLTTTTFAAEMAQEESEKQTLTSATSESKIPAKDKQTTVGISIVGDQKTVVLPSAQKRPSSPPRLKPPTFGSMAAPPRPGNGALRPPPSAASSLRVPATKVLSNASMAPTSSVMPPGKQVSRKVILEPGHSPLDWAALTSNPNSQLRGKDAPDNLIRVSPAQLKQQNGRRGRDAWTVYQGKVYNITPYVPFHPGGKGEILRGAGKSSDKLFMEVHPWVNWDGMLSECMVGILVNDEETADTKSGGLDDMD